MIGGRVGAFLHGGDPPGAPGGLLLLATLFTTSAALIRVDPEGQGELGGFPLKENTLPQSADW